MINGCTVRFEAAPFGPAKLNGWIDTDNAIAPMLNTTNAPIAHYAFTPWPKCSNMTEKYTPGSRITSVGCVKPKSPIFKFI